MQNNHEDEKNITQIAYRGYSAQSLIKISANIEYTTFSSDVIFVDFCQGSRQQGGQGFKYDTSNPISMLFNAIELRALAYAMKEIVKSKQDSGYEKITKSDGVMKKATVGYASKEDRSGGELKVKEDFYINAVKVGTTFKVGISFSKWDMVSFADTLISIANETEEFLYKHQRMIRKQQEALKKQETTS